MKSFFSFIYSEDWNADDADDADDAGDAAVANVPGFIFCSKKVQMDFVITKGLKVIIISMVRQQPNP